MRGAPVKFYAFTVDYSLSLEQMIAAGEYNCFSVRIISDFQVKGEGVMGVEIQLVHFNRQMETNDVIRELDKMRLRTVKIEELLAFGAKFRKVQLEFPVISLDSNSGDEVLYLDKAGSVRSLNQVWFGFGWGKVCRFAAVPKNQSRVLETPD